MDFAKKILNKYGWKEGEGLGKNNDGIVKPVKTRYKFDTAGLGQDVAASDYNNHWWERVFNEAAQNMEIQNKESGEVSLNIKGDDVEITTKGYSMKKLRKAKRMAEVNGSKQYSNFLQQTTLTIAGYEVEDREKTDFDISVNKFKTLTDEELFKACGGRTAHKGARHGLKLSGKLSRLEQQDQEILKNMQKKVNKNHEKYTENRKDQEKVNESKQECKCLESIVKKKKKIMNHKPDDSIVEQGNKRGMKRKANVTPDILLAVKDDSFAFKMSKSTEVNEKFSIAAHKEIKKKKSKRNKESN